MRSVIFLPKRKRNGEGSIYFDKPRGNYRVNITMPTGERLFKRFRTEDEALAWKTDQLHAMQRNTFVTPSKITLGDWLITYLSTYKHGIVKQTTYEYYFYLAKHLDPLADFNLQTLTALEMQKFLKALLDQGLSANTVSKIYSFLKDIYAKAIQLDMVSKNILNAVQPPRVEKKQIEIFTHKEIELILENSKDSMYYPLILLGVITGMRKGEILGLRWCDVDFSTNDVHIRQTLQVTQLGTLATTPKTTSSVRKIKLTDDMIKVLHQLKATVKNIDIEQKKLCFVTKNDTPINRNNFDRAWRAILQKSNITYKKMHTLRHTHATELLAAGIPIVEVARRLGHSKISHTLELYGHAIKNYDEKIAKKVQELYVVPK